VIEGVGMTATADTAPIRSLIPARLDRYDMAYAGGSAGEPIRTAKITAPNVPDWAVERPRITKLITQGTRWCPLTVLTGPPGAGKTMALALWAAAKSGVMAWVSLDGCDNRPRAFWSHVVAALRRSGFAVPDVPPAEAGGRTGQHVFLLWLASALAAQDPPVPLVLDDLHLLTDPQVLGGLDCVLRNAGPGLRLVVSARTDPLLPLSRYRLAGQLAEIRAGDLAFSIAEVRVALARHGITLPAGELEFLARRTEGWAVGIRLAALSVGTHPGPAPPGLPEQAVIPLVEPLTEREREVLRHYSDLFSVAEVAAEMHISVNTVKSHLKNVFRKLAATRRGEAVRRARQLQLI
jgi:ATP/maltotriose-dependent transcriptional regulator MalT